MDVLQTHAAESVVQYIFGVWALGESGLLGWVNVARRIVSLFRCAGPICCSDGAEQNGIGHAETKLGASRKEPIPSTVNPRTKNLDSEGLTEADY